MLIPSITATSFAATALAFQPCPLLGPVFPAPSNLADSSYLKEAFSALQSTLDNVTSTSQTQYGPWPANNNSFSIGFFDASSPEALFSYQWSSEVLQKATEGVTKVTENSVYRIGSASKLITAYMFMINAGPQYWNHAVTQYLPELNQAAGSCSASSDPIGCIDWDGITLGALASHMAGLPRDYALPAEILSPSLLGPQGALEIGLPPLPQSDTPTCSMNISDPTTSCTFKEYINGFAKEPPVYSPFTNPIYSNAAYVVLATATERITGKSQPDMAASLFKQLNMSSSSYYNPTDLSDAVIPLGVGSGFQAVTGIETPVGGYFSTQTDLSRLGQSLLSSSILTPLQTRQWMKPVAFTEQTTMSFGYMWEIFRMPHVLHDHVVDLYTKTGDLFSYSSHLILSPDYNVGFIILVAGNDTTLVRTLLADVVSTAVFPALEKEARQQAATNFAGTYKGESGDVLAVETQPGKPGLKLAKFITNGTDTFAELAYWGFGPGKDIQLYPTDLVQGSLNSTGKIAWRGVPQEPNFAGVFSPGCEQWGTTGAPIYGSVALDEFVFDVEDGKATAVSPLAWRTTLKKVS